MPSLRPRAAALAALAALGIPSFAVASPAAHLLADDPPSEMKYYWPLTYIPGVAPTPGQADANGEDAVRAAAALADALNGLFPQPTPSKRFVSAIGTTLVFHTPEAAKTCKYLLSMYLDTPSPQVRVDIFTIQTNTKQSQSAYDLQDTIQEGSEMVRDLIAHFTTDMHDFVRTRSKAISANSAAGPDDANRQANDKIDGVFGIDSEALRRRHTKLTSLLEGLQSASGDGKLAAQTKRLMEEYPKLKELRDQNTVDLIVMELTTYKKKTGATLGDTFRTDEKIRSLLKLAGEPNPFVHYLYDIPKRALSGPEAVLMLGFLHNSKDPNSIFQTTDTVRTRARILQMRQLMSATQSKNLAAEKMRAERLRLLLDRLAVTLTSSPSQETDKEKTNGAAPSQDLTMPKEKASPRDELDSNVDRFLKTYGASPLTAIYAGLAAPTGGTGGTETSGRAIGDLIESYQTALAESRDGNRPVGDSAEKFATSQSIADGLIRTMIERYDEDIQRLFFHPLRDWIAELIRQNPGSGLNMSMTTQLSVTARRPATLEASAIAFVPYNAPGATLTTTQIAKLTTSIKEIPAILEATKPTQTFTSLAPGVSMGIRPTVMPDGGNAQLPIRLTSSTDIKNVADDKASPVGGPIDFVKSSSVVTDLNVRAFDIFHVSTVSMEHTSLGDYRWRIPVLENIPLFGPMFRGPRGPFTKKQSVMVIGNVMVLPRSVDLLRYVLSRDF